VRLQCFAMSFPTLAFLTIRALHVLLAAVWLGSVGFMVLFVMPAMKETGPAAAPMMGAIAGLLSVIIGGAVVGRSMAKMDTLGGKAMALPEGSERAALLNQSTAARDRGIAGARIVLVLQMAALACMAIGHYV
jgi:hypothetical protein